jgi:hypothetical protein
MKYYGLPLQPMQESGAFLLRAMQNEEMPRLDLLVRESVQNALDAGRKGLADTLIQVDINLHEHSTEAIASIFGEGINLSALHDRCSGKATLLEIRDSLTEGLTGPLTFGSVEDHAPHGNLLKLVFEIGRTRRDDAAGGSWGLGKTCYFRMGVGLVIYYSRIRSSEGFEERLVASLVEDETRPDRLQKASRTGIAWWGAEEELRPVTSSAQIHLILEKLGIEPFHGDVTGTSILIPFLRDDLIPAYDEENGPRPWWYQDYESYIRIALERWFCARVDNPSFKGGPYLAARVNGRALSRRQMLPVFRATQSLYNRAVSEEIASNDYFSLLGVRPEDVIRKHIFLRNEFLDGGSAGVVIAALLTDEQLDMGAPNNNPSPGLCVFGRLENTAPYRPIVTFMRKPGMSICWDDSTESRGWSGGFSGSSDGKRMIALFVPQHDRLLLPSDQRGHVGSAQNLEGYLRSCERADHAAWVDISGMRVVEKIRSACGKTLREFGLQPPVNTVVKPSIRMARNLADLLLPARGFGSDGRGGKAAPSAKRFGTEGGPHRTSQSAPILEIHEVAYVADGLSIGWTLLWGSEEQGAPREIFVEVASESGPISADEWAKSGLGKFPFHLSAVTLAVPSQGSAKLAGIVTEERTNKLHIYACHSEQSPCLKGNLLMRVVATAGKTLRPILGVRVTREAEADCE